MGLEYQVTFDHRLDYLTNSQPRLIITVVQPCVKSRLVFHKAPCNLRMYTDDIIIYVIGPTPNTVISNLNLILGDLAKWCCNNLSTPHDLFVKRETSYILRKKTLLKYSWPKTNILQNSIAWVRSCGTI